MNLFISFVPQKYNAGKYKITHGENIKLSGKLRLKIFYLEIIFM
jgi:hypothetical protein